VGVDIIRVMKSHSKAPRGLVALGAAAVIAVYAAGFVRTRAAAARWLPDAPGLRRPAVPAGAGGAVAPATPTDLPIRPRVAAMPTPVTLPHTPVRKPVAPIAATASSLSGLSGLSGSSHSGSSALSGPSTSVVAPAQTPPMPAASVTTPVTDVGTTETATQPAEVSPAPKSQYRDGTYSGWGSSRHGDIEATVVIVEGRIASATITTCLTRYSCSLIAHLQGQVVTRQSPDVDYVSGATQSTDAFYYAVVDALSKAKGEALSKAKG
jgi:uncharacterized protein with FMN-binding domain